MDSTRVKLKIGAHELDAKGPPAMVQVHFKAFLEMVRVALAIPALGAGGWPDGEDAGRHRVLSALRAATLSEHAAVEFLEQHRWPAGTACPRCGSANVYQMKAADGTRNKDYRWRCRDCAGPQMFTVRTGTTFEESRLPLRVWVYAFWKACSSKKGISALQLACKMEITHKSALFVLRRIRHGKEHQA